MDANKVKQTQEMIKNHQKAVSPPHSIDIPVGAGRPTDDLSKVASNDMIGKGGDSDLRK